MEGVHQAGHQHIVVVEQRVGASLLDTTHGRVPDALRRFPVEPQGELGQNLPYRAAGFQSRHTQPVRVFGVAPSVASHDHPAVRLAVQAVDLPEIALEQRQGLLLGQHPVVDVVGIPVSQVNVQAPKLEQRGHDAVNPHQLQRLHHGAGGALCDGFQGLGHAAQLPFSLLISGLRQKLHSLVPVPEAHLPHELKGAVHTLVEHRVPALLLRSLPVGGYLRPHTGKPQADQLVKVQVRPRHADNGRGGKGGLLPVVGKEDMFDGIRGVP